MDREREKEGRKERHSIEGEIEEQYREGKREKE
jgi:hypothetical protein